MFFDSGIGGEAIAASLKNLLPGAEVLSVSDHKHVPYGSRPAEEIIALTLKAIQPLLDARCDAIIIACNTATTIAIQTLRSTYPDMKFIGIEPMVKPAAALTKTNVIAVLATPATLKSDRYKDLKKTWAPNVTVIEPDCRAWAKLIEDGDADDIKIDTIVENLLAQNADVFVLACTHYHWLKSRLIEAINNPNVKVLEPSDAIANRVKQLLV